MPQWASRWNFVLVVGLHCTNVFASPKVPTPLIRDLRAAYKTIKAVLERERAMRERVLMPGAYQDSKIREIDEALKGLQLLGEAVRLEAESPAYAQDVLFSLPPDRQKGG